MAATLFGVVVSTGNAHIRRYVYPDSDSELNSPGLVGPGETMIQISQSAEVLMPVLPHGRLR